MLNHVLIVIDVQKGFITDCSAHVLTSLKEIEPLFQHVIYTKFYNPNPSPFREILDYQKLSPNTEETHLAFTPRKNALIVDRPLYTCVTPELLARLKQLDAKEVFICGIATEACVLKTVLDLFEANIRTWIIEDVCASDQDNKYHRMSIELLAKLIGKDHIIRKKDLRAMQAA